MTPSDEYRVVVPKDLGAALKYFRSASGVSQAAVADRVGLTQSYVSRLESGEFGTSVRQILRLLRLVGCEVVVKRATRG